MNRQEKHAFVTQFLELKNSHSCMIVVHQWGLTADLTCDLRRSLHHAGGAMKVVQNRLVRRTLVDSPVSDSFKESFKGPTAVIFTSDPVAVSKVLVDFAKKVEKKLEILVGILDERLLEKTDVTRLSTLPPLEQLRAQLLNVLTGPAVRLVSVLKEAQTRFVRVLDAHSQKTDMK